MDTLDEEEFLDPRVKRTVGILDTWESSHLDEVKEQEKNAVQAITDSEISVILDRIIPDGGLAWFLVLTTWVSNGISNGVPNSFGLLLSGIVDAAKAEACRGGGGGNATATTACPDADSQSPVSVSMLTAIGNVQSCMVYVTTPVILLHANRARRLADVAYMGALLTTLGLFLCALVDYSQFSSLLMLHFSIIVGLGLSIQTTLQSTILSHYFNKRMSIAAGVTSSGNGVFSALLSVGISQLNSSLGVRFSFLMLSGLSASGLAYTQLWRANPDFLLLQKWVRTPTPLLTELLTARVMRNRRYLALFLSILCLYSGLWYPWMILVEYAKQRFPESQIPTITYVYTVRGCGNAVMRCLVGFVVTLEPVRRRLLYTVPANESMYALGLLTMLIGLQARSLPLLFVSAFVTALGESLVVATMPSIVARLTNPADTPAGLMLMNLTFSIASLLPPLLLSMISESRGGYPAALVVSCCFAALGCLISSLLIVWRQQDGEEDEAVSGGGGGGGGGGASEQQRYIALEGSAAMAAAAGQSSAHDSSSLARSRVRSAAGAATAPDNRSVTRRAVKHNACRVTAWRQQECNVGREYFVHFSERDPADADAAATDGAVGV